MTVIAGILGTAAGSELSKFLGKYTCRAEAIVCSFSMLLAVPFLYLSLLVVQYKIVYISLISVFLAVFFACLNWTPVAAMVLVNSLNMTCLLYPCHWYVAYCVFCLLI